MAFEVRELGSEDWRILDRVIETFKDVESLAPERFLEDPRAHAFVALEGSEILGWAYGYELFRPEGRRMMLLYELDVAEEARRQGVGKALVDAFKDLAQSKGHVKMWLFTHQDNAAARALYEAAGATPSGRPDLGYWWVFE